MNAIINGRIVLKNCILDGMALIFGEKITGFVEVDKCPPGVNIIDAEGMYVAPGLIDLHIHGYMGADVSDGDSDGIRKIAGGIVKNGVTGWLPTTMTVSREEKRRAFQTVGNLRKESESWNGAAILGVNSEGPFINPKRKGAQAEEYILKPEVDLVKDYVHIIKLITMAPEMDPGFETIKKLSIDMGIVVSMGHTDIDYETAYMAMQNGVKHVTHLFNAMTPLTGREPGAVGAALSNPVSVELIADTFHVHKGLFNHIYKTKGDKLVLVTDSVRAGGMPEGEYSLGGQKVFVKGIECRLEDGTIAGSVLTLNAAVRNLYRNSETSLSEAFACASLNPAMVIGVSHRKGSLEIGKDADIAIFDNDFRARKTIIGGRTVYEA